MYVNLNALVHQMATDLFKQAFLTEVPRDPEKFESDILNALYALCEVDIIMRDLPTSWVEITGDEPYVKRSLLDIS